MKPQRVTVGDGGGKNGGPGIWVPRVERWTSTGSVDALPGTGHCRSPLEEHRQWLLDLVVTEPDLTLDEIRIRIGRETKLEIGRSSVGRVFERHEITVKKKSARVGAGST